MGRLFFGKSNEEITKNANYYARANYVAERLLYEDAYVDWSYGDVGVFMAGLLMELPVNDVESGSPNRVYGRGRNTITE